MDEWIGRTAALERLNVRAQTLYAYVSRGRVGMQPDPEDPRRSLYSAADIERLANRRRRGRKAEAIAASAMSWGEPSIPTSISTVERGTLIYRGQDAVELSKNQSLEEVAALLWEQSEPVSLQAPNSRTKVRDGWLAGMAELAQGSRPTIGRSPSSLSEDAATAVAHLASCFGMGAGATPMHERIASDWAVSRGVADVLRQALVVLADHDLNASTFAVRVAASTGASIAASLLAGLATLSGPRHGGATKELVMLVSNAENSRPEAAVEEWLASGRTLPGFGHPLYPHGDVRSGALMACMEIDSLMSELASAATAATGRKPNIDFALVTMMRAYKLPQDAPFRIFALGRSIGWCAHAMEQVQEGNLIRPRGRYDGALIEDRQAPIAD